MELIHKELTDQIIRSFYDVYNILGYGFLERVYQNALFLELKSRGLRVEHQKQIQVYYKKINVGEYYADLIVNDLVVIELKCASTLIEAHEKQLLNYLKSTRLEVGLLLNFGVVPEFKRKVFSQSRK